MGEYVYVSVRKIYFTELFSLSCLQIAFPQIILDYLKFTIKTVKINNCLFSFDMETHYCVKL